MDGYDSIPFDKYQYKNYLVIQILYAQVPQMYQTNSRSVSDGLVSIDRPHVKRSIVRGKTASNMEFEAKIQITLMSGYVFLDELFWDGFN